jgi:histidyl-tRNA synthetase
MQKIQSIRGMHDVLGEEFSRHQHIIDVARDFAARYLYREIKTPILEATPLFTRAMGETSDVVAKEMYAFIDKGGEDVTLRPEGTAGVCRAIIEHGLAQHAPLKFFYAGPMFRYERPQKGRLRQFHQIGCELLGVETPQADIETIALGVRILDGLGIFRRAQLQINTLGDGESRQAYRHALVHYFTARREKLSADSQKRLEKNPLRILDSKDEGDKILVADAPLFGDYLNAASQNFFQAVQDGLAALNIPFVINPRLVRGLDYYCHTAFEIVTDALGAQGTILAGGRYDGLVESLGGPKLAGIGWGAGIERLAMMLEYLPLPGRPVAIVPVSEGEQKFAHILADDLRRCGLAVDIGFAGNVGKRMKRAAGVEARYAVVIGENETATNTAKVKDMDSGAEHDVPMNDLAKFLKG